MIQEETFDSTSNDNVVSINNAETIHQLEKKNLYYQEKYNHLKYFFYKGVTFILSRDYIDSFEWVHHCIEIEPIIITKENREFIQSIRIRYQHVLLFFNYITQLYIDFFRIENKLVDHTNEMILTILSQKYEIEIPFILHPEFDLDKYFFHRKTYLLTENDFIHTQKLVELMETFYFTLLNHLEEYEFIITEINKEILSKM